MAISRKNYERIAIIINHQTGVQILSNNPADYIIKTTFIDELCKYLKEDNQKFDETLFRKWVE